MEAGALYLSTPFVDSDTLFGSSPTGAAVTVSDTVSDNDIIAVTEEPSIRLLSTR